MDKKAYLQQITQNAFNDELQKLAIDISPQYDIPTYLREPHPQSMPQSLKPGTYLKGAAGQWEQHFRPTRMGRFGGIMKKIGVGAAKYVGIPAAIIGGTALYSAMSAPSSTYDSSRR